MAELAELLGEGVINSATAKKLLSRLLKSDFDPREAVVSEGLAQITDRAVLVETVSAVLEANPRAVRDYLGGKTAALRALQGQAMAKTAGRADPLLLESLLLEALRQIQP